MREQQARAYRFVQVDVFTDRIFGGNPLAVFLDGQGLTDEEMQSIAREMNLSETVFVLPPDFPGHTARLRIFTPATELPFAGHPTIGTTWVLARYGPLTPGTTEIVLEEGVGPVPVRLEGTPEDPGTIWMRHAPAQFGPPIEDRACIARALGLTEDDLLPQPVQVGSTGVPFLYISLADRETVDRAKLDVPALLHCPIEPEAMGVFIFAPDTVSGPNHVYSRMFAPHTMNIPEDPATGAASGPLGAYLVNHGLATGGDEIDIISEQGTQMGRQSFIQIRVKRLSGQPDGIEIGGETVPVLEGMLNLPVGM